MIEVPRDTLRTETLVRLADRGMRTPTYSRNGVPGVVHLGLGAFHRAHQALVFDDMLGRGDRRWGVLGVAMHNPALADALLAQDGLYAVQIASSAGTHWHIGGAIWRTCVAARERAKVVESIAAPGTRWVTLTVTEKGYGDELAALLVSGLSARRVAGGTGLTIASCDNLSGNGRKLKALCVSAARAIDPVLADWIETRCAYPDSMVDRIVPAATAQRMAAAAQAMGLTDLAALGTEAFWEWVIERHFVDATDAEALTAVGVTVVDNVGPFEEAKLRMLNGSHSAMACIGAVAGLPVISDCIAQADVRRFVHGLMTFEVGPQLKRSDWPNYRDALISRFANPALQHSVHQIATDSSQKIPQRWVPTALDAIRAGQTVDRLAFAAAAWMRFCLGQDELGNGYTISDPLAGQTQTLARAHAADAAATVNALGRLTAVWGDELPGKPQWLTQVAAHLQRIQSRGMLAALAAIPETTSSAASP
jgi:fructuronate reductase